MSGIRDRVIGGTMRECRPPGQNLVPDTHLAALALERGLTVVSTDTDFAKFPGVAWLNPVSAAASYDFADRVRPTSWPEQATQKQHGSGSGRRPTRG